MCCSGSCQEDHLRRVGQGEGSCIMVKWERKSSFKALLQEIRWLIPADVSQNYLKTAVGGRSSRSPLEAPTGTRHYSFTTPKINEIDDMFKVRNINSHFHWSNFVTGPWNGCKLFLNPFILAAPCEVCCCNGNQVCGFLLKQEQWGMSSSLYQKHYWLLSFW